MKVLIVLAVIGLVVALATMVFSIVRTFQTPQETEKQVEAHRLLVELDIIDEYMPTLPAEFKAKLTKYLRGSNP